MIGGGCLPLPPTTLIRAEDHRALAEVFAKGQHPWIKQWLTQTTCEEAAHTPSLSRNCYDGTADPPCVYCTAEGQADNVPCILRAGYGFDVPLCAGANDPVPPVFPQWLPDHPEMHVWYQDGYSDAEGDTEQIIGNEVWRYYLRPTRFWIDPCFDDVEFCGPGVTRPVWLCQWHTYNEIGNAWHMYCNRPIPGDGPGSPTRPQNVPREMNLGLDLSRRRSPLLVWFQVGGQLPCWWLEDIFCYSEDCGSDGDPDDLWNCVGIAGTTGQERVHALDAIHVIGDPNITDASIASGGTYPHANTDDIAVKRACWTELAAALAENFAGGDPWLIHGPGGSWDAQGKSRWAGTLFLGDRVVPDLEITFHEPLLDLSLPGKLTLQAIAANASINVEARQFSQGQADRKRCVFVAIELMLTVRPMLTQAAYAQAQQADLYFRYPDDPFDQRLRDITSPDQVHGTLKLLPTGPAGGRVPGYMTWHGLKAQWPYSLGPDGWNPPVCETLTGYACCDTLQAIEDTVVFGEVNDHGNPLGNQRFTGSIELRIPGLNSETHHHYFGCQCVPP